MLNSCVSRFLLHNFSLVVDTVLCPYSAISQTTCPLTSADIDRNYAEISSRSETCDQRRNPARKFGALKKLLGSSVDARSICDPGISKRNLTHWWLWLAVYTKQLSVSLGLFF